MKVIRARVLGFCSGVRRAVDIAWNESGAESGASRVYTLGPLIHNPRVLKSLRERGLGVLNDDFIPAEAVNSTVIIRAHGVSPSVEKKFNRQGVRIVDATCPHVKESQNKARHYAEQGYKIFLAGEKDHGEIAGIRGYVEGNLGSACIAAGDPGEAEEAAAELYFKDQNADTVLLGQTTFSTAEYKAIDQAIRKYFPKLVTINTICGATADRQKALKELCGKVDAVIIAGGKESSNTRRLLAAAGELGKPAWLVETCSDIPAGIGKYETVGLSAGASTPDDLIDEIEKALNAV